MSLWRICPDINLWGVCHASLRRVVRYKFMTCLSIYELMTWHIFCHPDESYWRECPDEFMTCLSRHKFMVCLPLWHEIMTCCADRSWWPYCYTDTGLWRDRPDENLWRIHHWDASSCHDHGGASLRCDHPNITSRDCPDVTLLHERTWLYEVPVYTILSAITVFSITLTTFGYQYIRTIPPQIVISPSI